MRLGKRVNAIPWETSYEFWVDRRVKKRAHHAARRKVFPVWPRMLLVRSTCLRTSLNGTRVQFTRLDAATPPLFTHTTGTSIGIMSDSKHELDGERESESSNVISQTERLDNVQERVDDLEAEVTELDKKLGATQDELHRTTEATNELKRQHDSLESDQTTIDDTLEECTSRVATQEHRIAALEQWKEDVDRVQKKQRATLDDMIKQYSESQKRIDELLKIAERNVGDVATPAPAPQPAAAK